MPGAFYMFIVSLVNHLPAADGESGITQNINHDRRKEGSCLNKASIRSHESGSRSQPASALNQICLPGLRLGGDLFTAVGSQCNDSACDPSILI